MFTRYILLCTLAMPLTTARAQDPEALEKEADEQYAAKQYAKSADLYAKAVQAGADGPNIPYSAACSYALAGRKDEAFKYLTLAIERGWHDLENLNNEPDLLKLHGDPRWPDLLMQCRAAHESLLQSMTRPDLRDELLQRMKQDQAGRKAAKPDAKEMMRVDASNTAWMKEVIAKHGWPGKSMVGEDGAFAAWLLVQHADADPKFQARCLELMKKAYQKKEVRGQDLAYLTDRVLVNQEKKQLYGTQFWTPPLGKLQPRPIEDEANVDARRAAMGLGSLADYKKIIGQQAGGG